jgi:Intracellular proteinase inhibitor
MNTRILIPLLLAGAVALACGSRSRADASTKPPAKSARPTGMLTVAPVKPAAKRDATPAVAVPLKSAFVVRAEARAIHFSLDLTNATKKNLELEFPSGQEYDCAVIDSTGREVYRWGKERMFTQSLQNRLLGAGETLTFEEQWSAPGTRGKLTAIATLMSSNHPVETRVEFVIP